MIIVILSKQEQKLMTDFKNDLKLNEVVDDEKSIEIASMFTKISTACYEIFDKDVKSGKDIFPDKPFYLKEQLKELIYNKLLIKRYDFTKEKALYILNHIIKNYNGKIKEIFNLYGYKEGYDDCLLLEEK